MVHTMPFLHDIDSQLVHKMQELKDPLSTGNDMLCYDERHPILLDCAMIFIICIRKVGGAANIILSPLWFTQCYYCSMLPFNLHTKYEIFGYPLRMAKRMP